MPLPMEPTSRANTWRPARSNTSSLAAAPSGSENDASSGPAAGLEEAERQRLRAAGSVHARHRELERPGGHHLGADFPFAAQRL